MSLESEKSTGPSRTDTPGERPGQPAPSDGRRLDRWLWAAALLGLVLDVGLSYHGILLGLPELNPLVHVVSRWVGLFGSLLLLKGIALTVAACGWFAISHRHRVVIPGALAVTWTSAAIANAAVLLSLP